MNVGTVGIVASVVVVVTEVVKEFYPTVSGNITRLVAIVIGAVLGLAGQFGVLPEPGLNLFSGITGALAAVSVNTLAVKAGGVQ